jgi:hypothetical protein
MSEEKPMHPNGIVMSVRDVVNIDPDRFPRLRCTEVALAVVVRHSCLRETILMPVVEHNLLWRRTLAVGNRGEWVLTGRRSGRSRRGR